MSIEKEKAEDRPKSLQPLKADKRDQQIAVLQSDLAKSKDDRLEERFWMGTFAAFLFDCFIFSHVSFALSLLLFLFQLVPMIYFAKKLGIDEVAVMLDQIGSLIANRIKSGKE